MKAVLFIGNSIFVCHRTLSLKPELKLVLDGRQKDIDDKRVRDTSGGRKTVHFHFSFSSLYNYLECFLDI